jgi:hypothetical protein
MGKAREKTAIEQTKHRSFPYLVPRISTPEGTNAAGSLILNFQPPALGDTQTMPSWGVGDRVSHSLRGGNDRSEILL